MDKLDRKILKQIQVDASLSHAQIGEIVHLSASQVSRRLARLQLDGILMKQVAILSEEALGLQVEAFVSVSMTSYHPETIHGFHERISALEEVLDCSATTGDSDYLLRVVSKDLRSYSNLLNQKLLGHGDVSSVRSSVVLERIKHTTELPLG